MEISIQWFEPVQLTERGRLLLSPDNVPDEIPDVAGVYYFSRRYGSTHTPFYIGETLNLRSRLRSHLNTVAIVDVLRGINVSDTQIRQGTRYFHYGALETKRNQDPKKCLSIVQKFMIRTAVEYGAPILNKNLTKIKIHNIHFAGNRHGRGWFDENASIEA
ncbi:hypothetical protein [Salinarimonas soli]|uniref:GIY-YIG domain-containing protein n=1 Tax=Salinarimonas soli TaxID=1638099 RepID=A0A5B2VB53_9HYPH|nr:hypothetical protein [Salinarimonas soli]KAA2236733.1 hypothetical protein F0L46_13270 [Salinarimonas soli]